jgi:TonB family protein
MNRICRATVLLLIAFALDATSLDSKAVNKLLAKGRSLSLAEAQELEKGLEKTPEDVGDRIELLSYYTSVPKDLDLVTIRKARVRHILWIVDHDPKSGFGLFYVWTGVYHLNCQGDKLADADAFRQVSQLWIDQTKKHTSDATILRHAASALQDCAPDQAEQLLKEAHDNKGLGDLYANAVLGITGETYQNWGPQGSDPALRQSPFAQKALDILKSTTDPKILVGATRTLLLRGANLWADGKLDWDYTALGNNLLTRAKLAAPDDSSLNMLPTTLPKPGEWPVQAIRVGGNVQSSKIVRRVTPQYPAAARSAGIEGTVRLQVKIDLDGKILDLHAESGPSELIPSAIEAVKQWEYKPTLLNGKPCYVYTLIDVNYTLSK